MKSHFTFGRPRTALVVTVFFLYLLHNQHAVALTVSTDGSVITPGSGGTLSTADGTWSFGTGPDQYGDWQLLLNGTQVGIGLYMEVVNGGQLNMADEPGPSDWWLWSGGQNGFWSPSSNSGGGGGNSADGTSITPGSGGTLTTNSGTWSFGTGPDSYRDYQLLLNGAQVGIGLYMEVANGGQLYMADVAGPSDWWLWNGSWSPSSGPDGGGGGGGGGDGGGGPAPYGVSAPNGYQWVVTFDDEFTQDSGVNGNLWNAGASNTDWCVSTLFWYSGTGRLGNYGGNYMFTEPEDDPCQSYPGTVSFDSSLGFGMTTGPQYVDSNGVNQGSPDTAIQTGGPTANAAMFVQTYGYWEASVMKSPITGGPHFDFWMHPIPECNDGTPGCWLPEIDVGEQPSWDANADGSNTQLSFGLADYSGGCGAVVDVGVDLTADFHTYAVWWKNDGSGPYGSMTFYFDGNQVLGPCVVSSQATNIASGLYTFLSLDGGSNGNLGNPDWVRWVRAWQLAPN